MTIKFNFYDIYGFALPGFLLLAVLWLPIGLIEGKWPDAAFSSALLGVIIAYITGHVLQTVAQQAIPSNFLGERFPSTVFLDQQDVTFSPEFKKRLANQISAAFELDVVLDAKGGAADRVRSDAFFLCRSALIKSKNVIYPEQFEGLYALMRGLCAAFGIAVVYYLGWAYSGLLHRFMPSGLGAWQLSGVVVLAGILMALVALVTVNRFKDSKSSKKVVKYSKSVMIVSLLVAAFAAGYHLGLTRVGTSEHRSQLLVASVLSFFASERCYSGYKGFALEFAKAVYRDFNTYEKPGGGPNANANDGAEDE